MATYCYKTNQPTPAIEAQVVGDELDRIRTKAGSLTPRAVVDASRSKRAVLHKTLDLHLPLEDRADKWAMHKARQTINVVTIIPQAPKGTKQTTTYVQAFVNMTEGPAHAPESRSYEPIGEVLADPEQRANLVQRAMEKLVRVQREFRHLRELEVVWAAIDEAALKLA